MRRWSQHLREQKFTALENDEVERLSLHDNLRGLLYKQARLISF